MIDPELAVGAVGAVFGAGVAWGAMRVEARRMRKDLNGVGRKIRRLELAMLAVASEEKREEIIKRFWPE